MRKRLSTIIVFLLAVMMVFTLTPMAAGTAHAASGDPAIAAGSDILNQNVNKSSGMQIVWYGGKDWYVIGYDGEGNAKVTDDYAITLLKKDVDEYSKFFFDRGWEYHNAYGWADSGSDDPQQPSVLRETIEGNYLGLGGHLSQQEQEAILPRTLPGGGNHKGYSGYDENKIRGKQLDNALLWPLSVAEARALPANIMKVKKTYWLRSPGSFNCAAQVLSGGDIDVYGLPVDGRQDGIRPAMNVYTVPVLMTSAAVGGKVSGEPDPDALTEIGTNSGNEWKLTIKDSAHKNFEILPCEVTVDSDAGTVTVPYQGAVTGENEYISAVIVNVSGDYTWYGRVAKASNAAGASVTIDINGKMGEYDRLFVFNEQVNGDKKTDFASSLQRVSTKSPGHRWEFTEFSWTGDEASGYSACKGIFTCKNDRNHIEEVNASLSEAVTEPACETNGKTTYTASISTESSLDGKEHSEAKDAKVKEAPGHSWNTTVLIDPTEETAGEALLKCSVCEVEQTCVIPPSGHDHDMTYVAQKDPGCESGMKAHYYCSKCDNYYLDEAGDVLTIERALRIPARGHKPGEPEKGETKIPTCVSPGGFNLTTKCENCGRVLGVERIVIPPDEEAHAWEDAIQKATPNTDGRVYQKCSRCDTEVNTHVIPKVTGFKLSATACTYNGKAKKPTVTVTDADGKKLAASDCSVSYSNNTDVGSATAKVTLKGDYYAGSKNLTFKIEKAANPLKVKAKTATVKSSKVKKKAQVLKVTKVIRFTNKGQGSITYAKASGNKKITINKKTGKVTVKKGLKKGTYKVTVKVKAAGNKNYNASKVKKVTFKVRVK